jgi:nicotinate-nucleotide adenylyltransferase
MNIGLFGGTFDPIHRGHIALAQEARDTYQLHRVYFVPASVPPHKQNQPRASYCHRYAMVALATANEKEFVPSLLESPGPREPAEGGKAGAHSLHSAASTVNYSIDTVRRLKHTLKKADRLFFLIGVDAFREIASWHEPEALLQECEFIIASRPRYSLADIANALPEKLRPALAVTRPFQKQAARGDLVLPGVTLHLLEGVNQDVSATAVREVVSKGKPLGRYVDSAVAAYIKKVGLYRSSS